MNALRATPTAGVTDLCGLLLDRVSPEAPGFGSDVYREGDFHYPDAYGLFLKAAVRMGHDDIAAGAAGWLLANSTLSEAGAPGWGLPFAYKTFGEGPNPPHTIYAHTTSMAVSGLMDWFEVSGDSAALATVEAALDHYVNFFTGRSFFYSTYPADNHVVPNIDGLMAAQYARYARLIDGTRGDRFKAIAKAVYDNLLDLMTPDGQWPYQVGRAKKNDVLHHAYVVSGLKEVESYLSLAPRLGPARRFLLAYQQGSFLREMPRPRLSRQLMELVGLRHAEPARLWGLGAWLTACGPADVSPSVARKLMEPYGALEGHLWVSPQRKASSVRHDAHLAWGLASLA